MLLRPLVPLAAIALLVAAQGFTQGVARTTADGVYTTQQANEGRELWASACNNCHTPHNGLPFKNKWIGRDLASLYAYVKNEMPKNDPGGLSDEEYLLAVAFLVRANGMPAGERPLPMDSLALSRIRFDSVRTVPTSTGPRR